MISKKEGAAAVTTQTDPDRTKLNADIPIEPGPKKQETITALRRDFVAEALRIVAVKASHAADDVDLGDDIAVEREVALIISHVRAAAATFREMQREAAP
jgi:hypothetical protein